MVPAVRPLGPLSMARGCARIDSRPDKAKIGSADRVEVHHARLLAVIGVRKTFPHGLDPQETLRSECRPYHPGSCGSRRWPWLSSTRLYRTLIRRSSARDVWPRGANCSAALIRVTG